MEPTSYWLDLPYSPRLPLTENSKADVAIIGGGITGISAAYHCAKQGLDTVLVERDILAGGPAGRNAGMVVEGRSIDFSNLVNEKGLEVASSLWQDTVDAREHLASLVAEHAIDCDLSRPGSLYLGFSQDDVALLRREADTRRAAGFECEIVESGMQMNENGSSIALHAKNDYLLHPVKFLRGLSSAAEGYGARIYEGTDATSFDERSVTTANGTIEAKQVIVAVEGDTPHASELGTHLIRSQALVTAPLPQEVLASLDWHIGGMLWTTEASDYASARKIGDRLFICKVLPLEPTPDEREANKKWQLTKLQSLFPNLHTDIEITHQWTCRMLETKDDHPHLGQRDGVYFAFGHGGTGLTNGIMAGKMLAEHLAGNELPQRYSLWS